MQPRTHNHREATLPSHKAACIATAALLILWIASIPTAIPLAPVIEKSSLNLEFYLGLDVLPDKENKWKTSP